jgi:hypothetical protein
MTVIEVLKTAGLITSAPLFGVAVLVILFIFCKPEKQRTTGELTFLSSKSTYWMKRKLPMFACPIIAVFSSAFAIKTFPSSPLEFRLIESFIIVVIFLFPFAYCTLKEVGYCKDYLYISNISNSIRVSFNDIENVWARNTGRSGWYIFISFKNKTRYGRKIYFLPYKTDFGLSNGDEHPVVIELKDVIQKNANSDKQALTSA